MIRKAKIKDVDIITELYIQAIGSSKMAKTHMKSRVLKDEAFVKELDGKIIGAYIVEKGKFGDPYKMNRIPYTVYWLQHIMVFQEHRKKYYGKEMMNHYFMTGNDSEVKLYKLVCKDHMVKYYKKFGFEVIERAKRKRGDKEHYNIMQKSNQ